jgi:hypothetical protein
MKHAMKAAEEELSCKLQAVALSVSSNSSASS